MDSIDLLEAGNFDKRRIFGKETIFNAFFALCEGKTEKENKMEEGMRHHGKEGSLWWLFFHFGAIENGRKGRTGGYEMLSGVFFNLSKYGSFFF